MQEAPGSGLIASRGEFHAALRRAFDLAAERGCRELWLADADFADWPLGERGVVDSLARWAASHRRLTLVASTFDEVARRHARFVEWRRHWSHIVGCRANEEIEHERFPTLCVASDLLVVRLADRAQYRGVESHEARDLIASREAIDALLQRSEEAFPVTTTGL